MSDGEFLLLFGYQPPSHRHPWPTRINIRLRQAYGGIKRRLSGFRAWTADGVSSGALTHAEMEAYRPMLSERYARVSRDGILALHLSFGKRPFQEHFFPAIADWLKSREITLTVDNFVPFYFVYGLLRGPVFPSLVAGRRVLLVHSATGEKRAAITRSVAEAGPRGIEWLGISPTRSFAERIDLSGLQEKPDICLLGGGVGKAMLFEQLAPLAVPCIDAGYTFEVWSDADKQWDRPFMTPDTAMDPRRIRFLPEQDRIELFGE